MTRVVGLLVLLLVAFIMFPPVRERVRPYAKPVLDPIYEWSAKNRVSSLLKYVQEEESLGRPVPDPKTFSAFLERRDMQENASLDPWGVPYYLNVTRRGYYVGSAGRDMMAGSADDIVSPTVVPRQPGQRR